MRKILEGYYFYPTYVESKTTGKRYFCVHDLGVKITLKECADRVCSQCWKEYKQDIDKRLSKIYKMYISGIDIKNIAIEVNEAEIEIYKIIYKLKKNKREAFDIYKEMRKEG